MACGKKDAGYREFIATNNSYVIFQSGLPDDQVGVTSAFVSALDNPMAPYLTDDVFQGLWDFYHGVNKEPYRDAYISTYRVVSQIIPIGEDDVKVWLASFPAAVAMHNYLFEHGTLYLDCPPPNKPSFVL